MVTGPIRRSGNIPRNAGGDGVPPPIGFVCGGEAVSIDHDGLFKELLLTFFKEFLELFAPGVLEYGDPADISLAATETFLDAGEMGQRRSDLVVRVKFTDGPEAYFLVHIEVESQVRTDVNFAKRMFHCANSTGAIS